MPPLSYWLGKRWLLSKRMLWFMVIVNAAGTAYGYEWYWSQLVYTLHERWGEILLPFVPDSPTASLFLLLAFIGLLAVKPSRAMTRWLGLFGAFGVMTCIKYGIWAVAMILAGNLKGAPPGWEGWMLSASHLGMAVEAVLYARFFRMEWWGIALASGWTLLNDALDYHLNIFPWLPDELMPYLPEIARFTANLSIFSILLTCGLYGLRRREMV